MVVVPYIAEDGVVRRRAVVESADVAAMFVSLAACWRKASFWFPLFVDAISIEDLRSRLLLRSVLVLTKELWTARLCRLVRGCCKIGWSFITKNLLK